MAKANVQNVPREAYKDCPDCFAAVLQYLHLEACTRDQNDLVYPNYRMIVISCGKHGPS